MGAAMRGGLPAADATVARFKVRCVRMLHALYMGVCIYVCVVEREREREREGERERSQVDLARRRQRSRFPQCTWSTQRSLPRVGVEVTRIKLPRQAFL